MDMTSRRLSRGFSLIEVMIAVVVLSFGLLALAALQGSLFRAGAESKARANATAIAQQVVENAKTFAFLSPPVGYTGNTYAALVSSDLGSHSVGGVDFSVQREVRRFLSNGAGGFCVESSCPATVNVGYSGARPEFKELIVKVSWSGVDGVKSVQLTDSVSSVSPADAAQVIKQPTGASRGPEVWIEPPNKDNPQVVPIAIGGDQSAASSNPKPEQFVQDISAATLFSVQTFTGDTSGAEVRLNRKIDVAAVSCVCAAGAATTESTPAYEATQWNGKQLAYMEPQSLPVGTKTGVAVVSNSSTEIETMCTVCCRDNHVSTRKPSPDPWRALSASEVGGGEHYGYKTQGNAYKIGEGLFPVGVDTAGQYVDACQLIRVNGLMRMAVDAQQNTLLVTPVTSTGYSQSNFVNRFSGFVTSTIADGMASLPAAYPGPLARFPAPNSSRLAEYSDIVTPAVIDLADAEVRKFVAFGLYVDYLNADTIEAYNCAVSGSDTGACAGLGNRNPLETLPLYAVNVANLGSWESSKAAVASVSNATYSNQGLLVADGGTVVAQSASSAVEFPVSMEISKSNTGLTATLPVDPDDGGNANFVKDAQGFTKAGGVPSGSRNSLFLKVGASSTLTLGTVVVTSPAGGTACTFSNKTKTTTCRFDSPAALLTVGITNYTTSVKVAGTFQTINRKVCVPVANKVSQPVVQNEGLTSESSQITLNNLGSVDYTLTIDIVNQADACPTNTAPLVP